MSVIVFGDSHTNIFCKDAKIPDLYPPNIHENGKFKVMRCGAPLAYSLGKHSSFYNARNKLEFALKHVVIQRSTLILSFGEIDCRYHVLTQARKNSYYPDNIVSDVVNKYISAVEEITKECESYKIKVFIMGPIATTWMEECNSSRDCPICGTMIERNMVTNKFNTLLKDRCKNTNIGFISIFNHLVKSNYETIRKFYLSDGIHLNVTAFRLMLGELKRKGIINEDSDSFNENTGLD